ncbi:C40 family peptidase [Stenotrophomonas maltophilia]|uniref:C40 family peptidase n=1 Tax=Stenotrophomonas maltophilia TaxID=40324 RepID=UPI00164715E2|nr:C40 family peptidase [Stenotrophomonas maltophilia]
MTDIPKVAHYPETSTTTPFSSGRPRLPARPWLRPRPWWMPACGGGKAPRPAPPPPTANWPKTVPDNPEAANSVLMRAISLVGTPYRYGGNTPDSGFDCSGLVAYVYREMLDLKLPRTSRDLAAVQGPKIDPQRLATGDLVFFGSRGSVTHVGIYVGEGRFVHAPSTGGTVRLDSLSGPYWKDHYTGAKRVLR